MLIFAVEDRQEVSLDLLFQPVINGGPFAETSEAGISLGSTGHASLAAMLLNRGVGFGGSVESGLDR